MLRIITANLNGIRSAASKGFPAWLAGQDADFAGVQEIKAQSEHTDGEFSRVGALHGQFHHAVKKGYAGVGLYTKHEPSEVLRGIDVAEFDDEGRWIEMRFDRPGRKFSVVSCYFPSGSSGEHRQQSKFRFLDVMLPRLQALQRKRDFILLGDVNIAHQEADLKNWKSNQKNSGFLPEERAWMSKLLDKSNLIDVYRRLHPDTTDDCYTWWSNRGQARANNVGWRIDYHIATAAVAETARTASIYKATWFSDHAPLTIDYDMHL
jgi:exodeoxyribonuclease III